LQLFFCNCSHMLFLQLFVCNHTAIRLQSHCDKVAITHMRQGCNHAHSGFATVFLQS
jgi:hypothetical protein